MDRIPKKAEHKLEVDLPDSTEDVYREIFHRYYNALLVYGYTISDRRQVVEDQVQEIFIWLYLNPDRYRSINSKEAYLFTALKRNVLAALKEEHRRAERTNNFSTQQDTSTPPIEDNLTVQDGKLEQKAWISAEIKRLPPRMREVIYLRYYRSLSYEEIAHVMSISTQVARNFAFRALKKVRMSRAKFHHVLLLLLLLLDQ